MYVTRPSQKEKVAQVDYAYRSTHPLWYIRVKIAHSVISQPSQKPRLNPVIAQ